MLQKPKIIVGLMDHLAHMKALSTLPCGCEMKTCHSQSKRKYIHYFPVWMSEENNMIALLEELVTTPLCRGGRKTTCFPFKRNCVLLSFVDVRGKQLDFTLRGIDYNSLV